MTPISGCHALSLGSHVPYDTAHVPACTYTEYHSSWDQESPQAAEKGMREVA